jgi:hypothetical protein
MVGARFGTGLWGPEIRQLATWQLGEWAIWKRGRADSRFA